MFSKKIKAVLFPLFLFFLLFAACLIFANELIQRPSVQRYLMRELSGRVGYDLRATHIELNLWKGIGISARDLDIKSPQGASIISASRIRIRLDPRALIRGRIAPTRLVLVEPELELGLDRGVYGPMETTAGDENILGALAAFSALGVEKGRVKLKGVSVDVADFNMDLSRTHQDPLAFTLFSKAKMVYRDQQIPLSVSGRVTQKAGQGLSGEVTLNSDAIPLAVLPWPRDLRFKGGDAKIRLKAKGSLKAGITVDGVLNANNVDFLILDEGDKKRFVLDRLSIPFEARYSAEVLELPSFEVKAEGFSLNGTAGIDLKDTSNPGISLKVTSPFMPLAVFKKIFPSSLLPGWLEARLFPCFSDGKVRVDDFALNGTVQEIEGLDRYENAQALSLGLTCEGMTAFKGEDVPPMQDVSGHVAVKKGVLLVTGMEAGFGDSEIKEGTLTVDTLYSDTPAYEASLSGSFEIEDLLRQQGLHFIPPEVTRALNRWNAGSLLQTRSVSGRLDAQVGVVYQNGWDFPRISNGAFEFKACRLNMKELIFPVALDTGTLKMDGKGGREFSAAGRWGRSRIKASGSMGESWRTGRARVEAEADLEELLHRFYPSLTGTIHAPDLVAAQLTLTREKGHWAYQGTVNPKGVFMEGEKMTVSPFEHMKTLFFDGRFIPGKQVALKELKSSQGTPWFTLSGTYALEGGKGMDMEIKTRGLKLQDLGVRFKNGDMSAKGSFSCDARVQVPGSDPLKTAVTGILRGEQITLRSKALSMPVTDLSFKVQCRGQTCAVESLKMNMGPNAYRVEGTLHGWEGLKGDLAVTANHLDLSELIGDRPFWGSKDGFPPRERSQKRADARSQFMERSNVEVRVDVEKAQWGKVGFEPIQAVCTIRGGDLYVNRAEVGLEYGRIRFKGHLKTGRKPQLAVSTYINITRMPVKNLPRMLDPVKKYVEGDLSLEGLLYIKGSNREAWLSSLTGGTNVLLENGVIKRSNIFIKILDFLSIKGMFTKDKAGAAKGLKFDKIEGPVDVENGIAQVEQMRLRGPVLNAVGRGKVDLIEKTVDGEVGVEPLGTIDLVISHLPVIGHLLTGDKKALYVDYFKVEGPLTEPHVRYIPFKSLGSGTIGFIQRLFLSPGRLFKNISDRQRDFKRKGLPLPNNLQSEEDMGP